MIADRMLLLDLRLRCGALINFKVENCVRVCNDNKADDLEIMLTDRSFELDEVNEDVQYAVSIFLI